MKRKETLFAGGSGKNSRFQCRGQAGEVRASVFGLGDCHILDRGQILSLSQRLFPRALWLCS